VTPNPANLNVPVTLVATVSHSTGPGSPSGTVTFEDGTTVIATESVAIAAGGTAQASFTTHTLSGGLHQLSAAYWGDSTYTGSQSSAVLTTIVQPTVVTANQANLTLDTQTHKTTLGPLTATLTTQAGVPIAGQTLVFSAKPKAGGPVVCSAVTNAHGMATCSPTKEAGVIAVEVDGGFTATFAGSALYLKSAGSARLVRTKV
jgi:hypothetical protein